MTQNKTNVIRLNARTEATNQDLMPYLAACAQRDKRRSEQAKQLQKEQDAVAAHRQDAFFREMFKEAIMCGFLVAFTILSILSFVIPVG